MRSIRRAALALGATALMLTTAGPAVADAAPKAAVGGGTGILLDGRAGCTMTAVGRDRAGRLVGLTAGHCGGIGSRVALQRNPRFGTIGRVVTRSANYDVDVISLDASRVRGVRSVGKARIARIGTYPQPFSTVCKSGRTTGFTCGPTLTLKGRYAYNYVCSAPGDSGGPILVGNRVVGMLNGGMRLAGPGTSIACVDPALPLHTPMIATKMSDILRVLNRTSAVGAGFRPV